MRAVKCDVCQENDATVHLISIVHGFEIRTDWCRVCAKARLSSEIFEKLPEPPPAKPRIRNSDSIPLPPSRFPEEATRFVLKALNETLGEHGKSRHVLARDLVVSCILLAKETFGDQAQTTFNQWGIVSSSDIGEMIFGLIENRILSASPEDNRSDFDELPFFEDNGTV